MKIGRAVGSLVVIPALTGLLAGCGPVLQALIPDPKYYSAFLWMTLNRGDLWVRANTCTDEQLVTAFILGTEEQPDLETWPITPDDSASVRLGSLDEIVSLVADGSTRVSISGVDGEVLGLDLADGALALLTETATSDDNTVLVATPEGTRLVELERSFLPEYALRSVCAPAGSDSPG